MIIKWYPRSWIQITTRDVSVCFDPSFLISNFKKNEFVKLSDAEDDYLPIGIHRCDYIFLTHTHKDHYKFETLKRVAHDTSIIFSPEPIDPMFSGCTILVKDGDTLKYQGLTIDVVPAYNTESGSSTRKVHKRGKCVGYIITMENRRMYIAGDTDYIPEMTTFRNIDIAFLPIGGTFTMNKEDAVKSLEVMKPKHFVPVHHMKEKPESLIGAVPEHTRLIVPHINEDLLTIR